MRELVELAEDEVTDVRVTALDTVTDVVPTLIMGQLHVCPVAIVSWFQTSGSLSSSH